MSMELKEQIRIAREAMGYDRETFAELMGVTVTAVRLWEVKGHGPKLARIKDVERVLNTTLNVSGDKVNNNYLQDVTPEMANLTVSIMKLPKVKLDVIVLLVNMLKEPSKHINKFNDADISKHISSISINDQSSTSPKESERNNAKEKNKP